MMNKLKWAAAVVILLLLFYLLIPLHLENLDDYSTLVTDSNDEVLRAFLNQNQQWHFPLQHDVKIPAKLETAVLTYEDRFFYKHPGINPVAIVRAFWLNIKHKRVKSGGSTITMQLARISQPKARTIPHKILEILQALKLEIKYSKKDILRMYLSHAPYGRNIVGYRAASLKYFGKEPQNITWSEAATLAVLPNAPGLIAPGMQQKRLETKRNKLLKRLHDKGLIDAASLELCFLENLPDQVIALPQLAPHLSRKINRQNPGKQVKTTLDKITQQKAEAVMVRHAEYQQSYGVQNLAVLIASTKSGEIKAYLGSQDYWDNEHNGKVDGVVAPRSTGSTLKPFLYALSMDKGLILPQTKIKDIPTYFAAFTPENASLKFNGLVTCHDALAFSLNVPAVRLLNAFGLHEFYRFLELGKVTTLFRKPDDYGLTLIIGGSEATLFDLVQLYRGLGNYGQFGNIYWKDGAEESEAVSLISPAASYLTLEIMNDLKRPGAEFYWNQYENSKQIAWKTGTSFGQRDAWALGVNPDWTVGVWIGNFTGEGNPALTGAGSAGPLLFEIFSSLPDVGMDNWFEAPLNQMDAVEICSVSGYSAGQFCPEVDTVLAPIMKNPLKICPYHKQIFLTDSGSEQVCSLCWEQDEYHSEIILEYPPAIRKQLEARGQDIARIPAHRKTCQASGNNEVLGILYPREDVAIYIPRDLGGVKQRTLLQAAHSESDARVYWYLDNEYLGLTTKKHELAREIGKGLHNLKLIDQDGNSAEVEFQVYSK